MPEKTKYKWVEPRIINMQELPVTFGALCENGDTPGDPGDPSGTIKCSTGNGAGKNQCKAGFQDT